MKKTSFKYLVLFLPKKKKKLFTLFLLSISSIFIYSFIYYSQTAFAKHLLAPTNPPNTTHLYTYKHKYIYLQWLEEET